MSDSNASSGTPALRKGLRQKKPSLKALESLYSSKLKKSGFVANISSTSSDDEDIDNQDIEKPKLLHDNDLVQGKEIFRFQSRKMRNSLAQKVAEVHSLKTPFKVRNKIKNKIAAKLLQESSGSEYSCSSEEDSSESNSNSPGASSDSEEEPKPKTRQAAVSSKEMQPVRTRGRNGKVVKYTIKTDEYFSSCTSKVVTSNNTLDKLETPRLPQYELQTLLSNMKLSKSHTKAINTLSENNNTAFEKWLYLLNENFNILLFGLGSKKNILKQFHVEYLKKQPVLVVNGFFPTLSIRNILDSIIIDMLELKENPANVFEACELIEQEFSYIPGTHMYLIVHNLDGDMLRNGKSQSVLARLSAVKNIHLIASIDHINAPLIWDHNKLSKFNFIWWDVTSFLPYLEETSFEKSMMVQKTGHLALSSLRNVFLSLTTNSKSIYIVIVKYQLEHGKSQYYQGLAFKELYSTCREAFIVSSDLALRAQLTEFVDHKMVKLKRSADGTEYLLIPLANALLQKFLDEHN